MSSFIFTILLYTIFHLTEPITAQWSGDLVFQDEFDGDSLNTTLWEYDIGCSGFGEENLECYRQENILVQDGRLIINAKIEASEDKQYTSGRIRQTSPGFTYGTFVVRAKLPNGKHLWPAIWMLPTDRENTCKFEEIDIMSYRGQATSTIEVAAFYGKTPNPDDFVFKYSERTFDGIDFSQDFHEFALLWAPDKLDWYVDNELIYSVSLSLEFWQNEGSEKIQCEPNTPFAQPFQYIFNLAVGGIYFQEFPALTVDEAQQWSSPTFEIDWVRIFQE